VRDLDHLSQLIRVEIASVPGVVNLETMLVLAESVSDDGWPIYPSDDECASRPRTTAASGAL